VRDRQIKPSHQENRVAHLQGSQKQPTRPWEIVLPHHTCGEISPLCVAY
jgi:hypothetical protein